MPERRIKLAQMDPELVSREIGDFVLEAVTKFNHTGCVIGLSGGVDSTTTAALIKKAFDRYNCANNFNSTNNVTCLPRLELVGYILPAKANNPADAEDGIKIAQHLGIRYEVRGIEEVLEAYRLTNPEAFTHVFDKGNLASRVRANILNTKAATEKKILAGTGNRDEDFSLGYYTLFGDGAIHLSPIGNLPKRLVREMARYLGLAEVAERVPTAGLEPNQTDFGDLGYSYDTAEIVTEGILQGFSPAELYKHWQIVGSAEEDIRAYEKKFNEKKFSQVGEVVEDILRRRGIADAKARIVHPPAATVTLRYI